MKAVWKGALYGVSLVLVNYLCCILFGGLGEVALAVFAGVAFFAVGVAFLVSPNLVSLLACGFCGLFAMVFCSLRVCDFLGWELMEQMLIAYVGGFFGTLTGLFVAVCLTAKEIPVSRLLQGGKDMNVTVESKQKITLLVYGLISAITFSYLVMPQNAGISVVVFCLIQLGCLWFAGANRKKLWLFVPVMIFSVNCLISASTIWRPFNLLLSAVCYGCMFVDFDFCTDSFGYLKDVFSRLFSPFLQFGIPFRWLLDFNQGKAPLLKKIGLALLISIPCALLLIGVLANADMVFSLRVEQFADNLREMVNGHLLYVALCGILAGLYLFGMLYQEKLPRPEETAPGRTYRGDLVIINILLSTVLVVYTLFVVVQFKYLFAGSVLPLGLTYTQYARKGFFELLWLTGVNLAGILAVIRLTKEFSGKWFRLTKMLCHYLCGVTVILLASSFYRMLLYTNDDGFTRLRLFVLGFLVFELLGLIATFFYIAKPKFNITLTYAVVALTYYLILNLVPVDRIIAENQVNRYLNGECESLSYVYTLSADAAPALQKLYEAGDDATRQDIRNFLEENTNTHIPYRWQRYNIPAEQARDLLVEWYY